MALDPSEPYFEFARSRGGRSNAGFELERCFMTEAETRAAAWLEAWDSQGIHRTGTAGDLAGARWLAAEAAALGAKVDIEEFTLNRLDPVATFLEIDGDRIPAVPLFDALPTAPEGIAGRLDLAGSDAEIGVVKLSPNSASTRPF